MNVATAALLRRSLTWTARLLVGGVFLWAAIEKIIDPVAFAIAIRNYHLLPEPMVGAVAVLLPWLEAIAAIALLIGRASRGAALIIGVMLMVFTVAIAQAIVRDIDIDCGCFGSSVQAKASWTSVWRNLGLLAGAIYLVLPRQRLRPARAQRVQT